MELERRSGRHCRRSLKRAALRPWPDAYVESANPASAGIGPGTWMTACSTVRTSIKLCGADYTSARNPAPISPEWRLLLSTVSPKVRARLLPIAAVMTKLKVGPAHMGQEHVQAIWENVGAIYPDAETHEKCRVAVEYWNRCTSLPNWPQTTLVPFSLHDRDVFPPERFSDAFNRGVEEIRRDALAPRRGVLDRRLPVVPKVAEDRCDSIYRVWSAYCRQKSVEPGSITSPYNGLTPDILDAAIEYFRKKHGQKKGHDLHRDAINARMTAHRFTDVSELDAKRFDRAVKSVDPNATQSETTKSLLLRLRDPVFTAKLLGGPERIMKDLESVVEVGLHEALLAQSACAWALLLAAPIGVSELSAIQFPTSPGEAVGRLKLVVVDQDGEIHTYEIARQYASVITRYWERYLPILGANGDGLFPGNDDGHKQSAHLGVQISAHVSEHMSVKIPAITIPILAGGIYLIHRPGHYDVVRRLTRRGNVESTQRTYAILDSGRSSASFEKVAMSQVMMKGRK